MNVVKTIEQLEILRNKGGYFGGINKAKKALIELKKELPEAEYWRLCVAHSHFVIGEGSKEIWEECKSLIGKYKSVIN